MKKFFSSGGVKILLGTVLVITGVALVMKISGISFVPSVVGFFTTPMQKISNSVANLPTETKSVEELQRENEELEQKLNNMIALTVDYYDLKRENEQYVKYLELKKNKNDYQFASAAVIGRSASDLFYNFTIDQGSLSGISKYDPVITEKGLVGWVSDVYKTYSKVTTILSPETKVSVVDQVNKEAGITTGNIRYADLGVLQMEFVSNETTMAKGDIIVTAGVGGIYPSELPVGEIEDIYKRENTSEVSMIIRPYEDIQNVKNVFVITDFLGQGDVIPDVNG